MNTMIWALCLFIITYILLIALQKFRPFIALGSALVFVLLGSFGILPDFSFTFGEALAQIDWNVILMIVGMMGTVYIFTETGMPSKMSDALLKKSGTVGMAVVIMSLFAGVISAFVDNVATVLMVAPVALAMCRKYRISPVGPIICIAISSNLQGAATLVGDTTSILLAKAAQLDFLDFFVDNGRIGMFFVVEAGALASAAIIYFIFRKNNQRIDVTGETKVSDIFPTITLLLTIVSLIAVSFIPYKDMAEPGGIYKPDITNGLICVGFFLITLIRDIIRKKDASEIKAIAKEIDWFTLGLLVGLFIIIGAVEKAGVIAKIGELMAGLAGKGDRGSIFAVYSIIVWGSVIISAFIDNIPYTVTMLPIMAVVAEQIASQGMPGFSPKLLYYGLLCGATLGGNLTPIGASANVAALGILRKEGYEVKNTEFMKYGVPFTLTAVAVGYLMIWFIWM